VRAIKRRPQIRKSYLDPTWGLRTPTEPCPVHPEAMALATNGRSKRA
jgi:hypothetical protein